MSLPTQGPSPPPSYATEAPDSDGESTFSGPSFVDEDENNEATTVPTGAAPPAPQDTPQAPGASTVLTGQVQSEGPSPWFELVNRALPPDIAAHRGWYAVAYGREGIQCVVQDWPTCSGLVTSVSRASFKKYPDLLSAKSAVNDYRAVRNQPPIDVPVIPSGTVIRFPSDPAPQAEISSADISDSLLAAELAALNREREEAQNKLPASPPVDDVKALEEKFSNMGATMGSRLAELDNIVGQSPVHSRMDDIFRARPRTGPSSSATSSRPARPTLQDNIPLPRFHLQAHGVGVHSPLNYAAAIDARLHHSLAQVYLDQTTPAIALLHDTRERSHAALQRSRDLEEQAQAARASGQPMDVVQRLEEEAMIRLTHASSLAHSADTLYQRVSSLLTQADHESELAEQVRRLNQGATHGEGVERFWTGAAPSEDDEPELVDYKGKGKAM